MLIGAVALTLSPLASSHLTPGRKGPGDVALYRAEVERVRNGEGYYQAAAAELTARHYTTQSVFNWRTPLPMWLLGKMPSPACGKALLGLMALAAIMMALAALAREEDGELRHSKLRHSERSEESSATVILSGAKNPIRTGRQARFFAALRMTFAALRMTFVASE